MMPIVAQIPATSNARTAPGRYCRALRGLCIVSACAMLTACGAATSPEESVRAWLAEIELAVEEEDRGEVLDLISDKYKDARGNSRKEIGDRLLVYFLRQNNITLVSKIDEIVINDETAALVAMTVGMAGANGRALGFSADAYRFQLELEQTAGEWRLIGAKWAELGATLK